jgi:hypothetical protein
MHTLDSNMAHLQYFGSPIQSIADSLMSTRWLESTVLDTDGLRRLPIALEIVSKDLLEEYREPSDTSVVDFLDLVAH